MNFLYQGDFKIHQSWENRSNKSRSKQRPKSKNSINNNSSLMNAAKNVLQPSTDLLDDAVTKKILRDFAAQIPPPSTSKSQKKIGMINVLQQNKKMPPKAQKIASSSVSNNQDNLLTSMASRLKQLQLTTKSQRQQLRQKSILCQKLTKQNQFLKSFRSDSSSVLIQMSSLKQQNNSLNKKIKQMQQYLKKYGVKWIGYNIQGKLDHESLKKDIKKPKFNYRLPAEIDITTIIRRVEELNATLQAEGMGTEVHNENGVHKFRKAEPLAMGFFANGIAIKGFKFFPYKSKQSLQILSDLVDGYFPYVLKHKYPNGVFLNVVDKILVKYEMTSSDQQKIVTMQDMQVKVFQPPSKQQFLSKLPKQVIKNGKIIQIRSEIQKKLNNAQTILQVPQQEIPECQISQQGLNIFLTKHYNEIKTKKISQDQVVILKIRTLQGKICVLHLDKKALVSEVYSWMAKVVKANNPFLLMGNYPRRVYQTNQKQNLEQLGLYPNAILHVHMPQNPKKE